MRAFGATAWLQWVLTISVMSCGALLAAEPGLVGHWRLRGDVRDSSGHENHGIRRGVGVESGEFNGRESCVEVPHSPTLRLGTSNFAIAAWVHTDSEYSDVIGDVVTKFDARARRGLNLSISASAAGYNSSGGDKHVHFGLDDGTQGEWQDCGRPGGKTHNSDALTVFDGHLYAGTTDAPEQEDWAHVFRQDFSPYRSVLTTKKGSRIGLEPRAWRSLRGSSSRALGPVTEP